MQISSNNTHKNPFSSGDKNDVTCWQQRVSLTEMREQQPSQGCDLCPAQQAIGQGTRMEGVRVKASAELRQILFKKHCTEKINLT